MSPLNTLIIMFLKHLKDARSCLSAMFVSSVLFVSCGDSMRGTADYDNLLRRADSLYNAGDYIGAQADLQLFLFDAETDSTRFSQEQLMEAWLTLGNVHFAFGDYANAKKYYEKGLYKAIHSGNPARERRLAINLSVTSGYLGQRDDAVRYSEWLRTVKDSDSLKINYYYRLSKAYIELNFGQPRRAVSMMRDVMQYVHDNNMNRRYLLSPASDIYGIYERAGEPDSALVYLALTDSIAREWNLTNIISDCNRGYMRVYTMLGDLDKALYYQEAYFSTTDSLMNMSRFHQTAGDFQHRNEAASLDKIRMLQDRNLWLSVGIVVLLLMLLLIVGLVMTQINSRRMRRQLFRRNRELAVIDEQKKQIEATSATDETDGTPPESEADDSNRPDDKLRVLYESIVSIMEREAPYCDPDFSLARMAELTRSNTKYVSQAINDYYKGNFRTFINEYRIREARLRLSDTRKYGNTTIQYISESVGFMSTSSFNAAFKRVTGMTPSVYQKMARCEHTD